MLQRLSALLAGTLLLASIARADDLSWVEESNHYAQVLLDVLAKYNPEAASAQGVEGHDADVVDLKPRFDERAEADLAAAAAKLTAERHKVSDARVKQDIDILIVSANQQRNSSVLNRRLMQPYQDLTKAIFTGFHGLLDDRVPKKRQAAAVKRLHRYAGAEKGYEPITTLARARIEERLDGGARHLAPLQRVDDLWRRMDGHDLEVIPRRPVEVDGDGPHVEHPRQLLDNLLQGTREIFVQGARLDLDQAAQGAQDGARLDRHGRQCPIPGPAATRGPEVLCGRSATSSAPGRP